MPTKELNSLERKSPKRVFIEVQLKYHLFKIS